MLSLILSILTIPFVPIFFYSGGFVSSNSLTDLSQSWSHKVVKGEEVLGASQVNGQADNRTMDGTPKDDNGFQNCNLFPLNSADSEFMPAMKTGSTDIKLFAGSSVVIDVDSGTLLHYDNGRKKAQIASLTKMMTAILTVENIKDLDNEVVTIPPEALKVDGTVVGCPTSVFCNGERLHAGEKVKAIDLLKVMLLNSANDAATTLGIHIAGSADKFVDMMNAKARTLGLEDTHFCTPSGLEIDGHEDECYSSAYDIGRIAVASLKYNLIWDIMKIPSGTFYSTDGKDMHVMQNTDLLLGTIPNCLGGKTGFTPLAGKSLMLGSVDPTGKHRVISVILNDENRWDDMRKLTDWVFANYDWK
jgi:D-alanyl-D-alanine carboxypeptidase